MAAERYSRQSGARQREKTSPWRISLSSEGQNVAQNRAKVALHKRQILMQYQLLSRWLGRLDSNQGMAESKSAALPLGYAPTLSGEALEHDPEKGKPVFGRSCSMGRAENSCEPPAPQRLMWVVVRSPRASLGGACPLRTCRDKVCKSLIGECPHALSRAR